jgi:hypothetical protein
VHDDVGTVRGFASALAVGGVHLLLAPLPWQTGGGGLRVYLTFPEMVAWWCLLPVAVVPGLVRPIRWRFDDVLPILIFVVGLGTAYSLLFSNIGLIFRQRSQLLPWFFVFAGVGIDGWLQARTNRKPHDAGRECTEFNPVGDDGQNQVESPH